MPRRGSLDEFFRQRDVAVVLAFFNRVKSEIPSLSRCVRPRDFFPILTIITSR